MTATDSPIRSFPDDLFDAFDAAQRTTIALVRDVASQLDAGMSERDVSQLLTDRATSQGFTGWFHKPHVRFGGPQRPSRANSPLRKLANGDLVEFDLAPATDAVFADFGTALVYGGGAEPQVLVQAREICRAVSGFASRWKCTGELFVYAQAWATNRGASLGDARSVGHVCLAREASIDWAWPTASRAAILLRRNQIQWFNPRRMSGFFAVQPRLVLKGQAVSFEEMILVDGDTKRIVGRDSIDEIGTL